MLLTIGTSNRTRQDFFRELVRRDVWLMVDVRSKPYSRNPWANGRELEIEGVRHGIQYAWSGSILGGLNSIPTTDRAFRMAADTLLDTTDRGTVAIFCAEGDPAQCHRSYKVAAYLLMQHGFVSTNILRSGRDEDVRDTLSRTRGANVPDCLRDSVYRSNGCGSPLPWSSNDAKDEIN